MEMVKSLGILSRSHSLVDFQLSVKSDSISFPEICARSAKCYTGFCSSRCNLIINVHCSGESASNVDEFINNLQFLFTHCNSWFAVWFSRCWLVHFSVFLC